MSKEAAPTPASHGTGWRVWAGLGLVGIALLSFVVSSFFVDWDQVLAQVRDHKQEIQARVQEHVVLAAVLYFVVYVLFTSLALPGALILTLIGGALFGLWGIVLTSFASTMGATLSFLASRYLFRDYVQTRYGDRLQAINQELDREGLFYLLALRLNPVVPFFLVNLLFGLTRMPAKRFWWVSQLGMFPATVIYTYAGQQLGNIQSVRDIMSWQVVLALIALGLFPLAARKVASWLRKPA